MALEGKPITMSNAEEIVRAVRADKIVGEGTCSVVDECYTDGELLEQVCFDWDGKELKRTPKQAVTEMRKIHRMHAEREREHRANW